MARGRVVLQSDVVGAASLNAQVATGLSINLIAGRKYHVRLVALHSNTTTSTGVSYHISAAPTTAATRLAWVAITADGAGTLDGGGYAGTAYNTTGTATPAITTPTTSLSTATLTIMEGIIVCAATQVAQVEFISDVAEATTLRAGSFLDWEEL